MPNRQPNEILAAMVPGGWPQNVSAVVNPVTKVISAT